MFRNFPVTESDKIPSQSFRGTKLFTEKSCLFSVWFQGKAICIHLLTCSDETYDCFSASSSSIHSENAVSSLSCISLHLIRSNFELFHIFVWRMSILLVANVIHSWLLLGKLLWGFKLDTVLSKNENQIRSSTSLSRKVNSVQVCPWSDRWDGRCGVFCYNCTCFSNHGIILMKTICIFGTNICLFYHGAVNKKCLRSSW